MFSSRLQWAVRPNRLSLLLEEKRRIGAGILDLTESNPTRAGFKYPDEIAAALSDSHSLSYEPTPAGLPQARASVSSYYAGRGFRVDPERIFLTASTSEAYSFLFKLLADPGDEILIPQPSYPLFDYLPALESVQVAPYSLAYHGRWMIDLDSLSRQIGRRTRAIVVVNPNNPTGSFLKKSELQQLIEICRKNHLAIISDEVFSDFTFAPDDERVSSMAEVTEVLAFSLSGLSKIAGLPQMKLGWIVLGGPAELVSETPPKLELIADTYLSVSTPVQHAAPALLEHGRNVRQQILGRVRENLAILQNATVNSACRPLNVEGGWYAVL